MTSTWAAFFQSLDSVQGKTGAGVGKLPVPCLGPRGICGVDIASPSFIHSLWNPPKVEEYKVVGVGAANEKQQVRL